MTPPPRLLAVNQTADCDDKDKDKDAAGGLVARHLFEGRVVMVTKPVDRDLMTAVVAQLLALEAADAKAGITIYLNCPGGDADSGFGIYDAMRWISCPITTICAGLAASAAIVIFLGAEPDRRFTLPHSRFLIHQPSSSSQGQASDLEITANEIIKTRDKYNGIISEHTGKAPKQIVKDANRDFWLSAKEAVDYGLASRVVTQRSEI